MESTKVPNIENTDYGSLEFLFWSYEIELIQILAIE